MKKIFEYRGTGAEDPILFTTLRKAYEAAREDVGDIIQSYRTVQSHIRNDGMWEEDVEWLGDYIAIVKREVL